MDTDSDRTPYCLACKFPTLFHDIQNNIGLLKNDMSG